MDFPSRPREHPFLITLTKLDRCARPYLLPLKAEQKPGQGGCQPSSTLINHPHLGARPFKSHQGCLYQEDHQGGKGGCRTERDLPASEQSPEQVGFYSRVSSSCQTFRTRLNHLEGLLKASLLGAPAAPRVSDSEGLSDSVGPKGLHFSRLTGDASGNHTMGTSALYTRCRWKPTMWTPKATPGKGQRDWGSWGPAASWMLVRCWVHGYTSLEGTKCVVSPGPGSSITSSYLLVI